MSNCKQSCRGIRAMLLFFWLMWFFLGFSANLNDGLMAWHVVHVTLPFTSDHYEMMLAAMPLYHSGIGWINTAFTLTLIVNIVLTVLFLIGFVATLSRRAAAACWVHMAFGLAIAWNLLVLLFERAFLDRALEPASILLVIFLMICAAVCRKSSSCGDKSAS